MQSPHCAASCLPHIHSSGQGAVVCKSRATRPVQGLAGPVSVCELASLKLLSQCGSTHNCLNRSIPAIGLHAAGTLSNQLTNNKFISMFVPCSIAFLFVCFVFRMLVVIAFFCSSFCVSLCCCLVALSTSPPPPHLSLTPSPSSLSLSLSLHN